MMHIMASILGIIGLVAAIFFMPIDSTDKVTDFQTLAQYIRYSTMYILGNLLIWVSALTSPR